MRLTRIESREKYRTPKRISAVINLLKQELTCYKEGRVVPDDQLGSDIWQLIDALNAAEHQIEALQELVKDLEPDEHQLQSYLEKFPEDDPRRLKKYQLEDARVKVHYALRLKDESAISRAINRLNLLEEKFKIKV